MAIIVIILLLSNAVSVMASSAMHVKSALSGSAGACALLAKSQRQEDGVFRLDHPQTEISGLAGQYRRSSAFKKAIRRPKMPSPGDTVALPSSCCSSPGCDVFASVQVLFQRKCVMASSISKLAAVEANLPMTGTN